jgi:hypothetical protein
MEFHPVPQSSPEVDSSPSPASAGPSAAVAPLLPKEGRPWSKHPGTPSRIAQALHRLSPEQISSYDRDGFLLLRAAEVWTPAELKLLLASVNEMEQWPDQKGKWMKYYEVDRRVASNPKLLCRMENFTQYSPALDFILNGDKLPALASDLFGESSILYKEKVNMKLPGGAGFTPHQDVAAGWWMYGQTLHLSCLVSIDAATVENGCLEVVPAHNRDGLLSDDWQEMPSSIVQEWDKQALWQSVPTAPGDVLFFDSYVPHRSAPNDTQLPRRVLYATYAKASEGDLRSRYYADKRAAYPPDCEREDGRKYEYKV